MRHDSWLRDNKPFLFFFSIFVYFVTVVFDVCNAIVGYVHVGTCRVSPDHNFIAYTIDITGSEQFMLQIKDLRSGSIIPELQVNGIVSVAWAQDGRTLFYTQSDENQRPCRQTIFLSFNLFFFWMKVFSHLCVFCQGSLFKTRIWYYGQFPCIYRKWF